MVQSGAIALNRISKIFQKPPASTYTIHSVLISSGTLGGWGGYTDTTSTTAEVKGVPYSVINKSRSYNSHGLDAEGNLRLAVPGNTVVSQNDYITGDLLSGTYEVVNIQDYPYNEVNLARVLFIRQKVE